MTPIKRAQLFAMDAVYLPHRHVFAESTEFRTINTKGRRAGISAVTWGGGGKKRRDDAPRPPAKKTTTPSSVVPIPSLLIVRWRPARTRQRSDHLCQRRWSCIPSLLSLPFSSVFILSIPHIVQKASEIFVNSADGFRWSPTWLSDPSQGGRRKWPKGYGKKCLISPPCYWFLPFAVV